MSEITINTDYCSKEEYEELEKYLNKKGWEYCPNNPLQIDYDELYDDNEELKREHEDLKENYYDLKEAAETLLLHIEDAEQDKDKHDNPLKVISDLKDALNVI